MQSEGTNCYPIPHTPNEIIVEGQIIKNLENILDWSQIHWQGHSISDQIHQLNLQFSMEIPEQVHKKEFFIHFVKTAESRR